MQMAGTRKRAKEVPSPSPRWHIHQAEANANTYFNCSEELTNTNDTHDGRGDGVGMLLWGYP